MPHDLEFLQLALEQPALGTLDGCDYVRVDAVWCLPHDGSNPQFYAAAHLWEQSPAGRAIGRERYIADLETALAVRDAKIVDLVQQLAQLTPTDCPCPVGECDATYPHDRALSMHMQRKHGVSLKAWQAGAAPVEPTPEPIPDPPPEPPRMRAVAALHAAPITTAAAVAPVERVTCPDCDKTYKNAESLSSHRSIQHPQPLVIPEPPALPELPIARHWVCDRCHSDAFAPSVGDPDCCMRCAAG